MATGSRLPLQAAPAVSLRWNCGRFRAVDRCRKAASRPRDANRASPISAGGQPSAAVASASLNADHEVVLVGAGPLERVASVSHDVRGVPIRRERGLNRIGNGRLVLDDENAQTLFLRVSCGTNQAGRLGPASKGGDEPPPREGYRRRPETTMNNGLRPPAGGFASDAGRRHRGSATTPRRLTDDRRSGPPRRHGLRFRRPRPPWPREPQRHHWPQRARPRPGVRDSGPQSHAVQA